MLRNVLVIQFINPSRVFFVFVFVIDYKFFYPHFSIRVRHPRPVLVLQTPVANIIIH